MSSDRSDRTTRRPAASSSKSLLELFDFKYDNYTLCEITKPGKWTINKNRDSVEFIPQCVSGRKPRERWRCGRRCSHRMENANRNTVLVKTRRTPDNELQILA